MMTTTATFFKISAFLCIGIFCLHFVESKEYVRVCYYTNWSKNRGADGFYDLTTHYEDKLCTHIIYSFGKVAHDGKGWAIHPYETDFDIKHGYPKLNKVLKGRDKKLKTLLAIGGWNHASIGFKDMVDSRESRKYFIKQSKAFLIEHGFDGLDLDWEYPARRGSGPEDKEKFADLCAELRQYYGTMLVTAAVAAGGTSVDTSYNVPRVAAALDFINIMSYDLHGSWARDTGHHTDMNPERPYPDQHSVHNSVYHWIKRGAPANKLVLGLASYGRTWKLAQPCSDWGIGATGTWAGGKAGKSTGEMGFLAYYEICKKKWVYHKCSMDSNAIAPYGTDGRDWIGYDDVESIVYKVNQLVKRKNLRGLMFWALDLDDFTGSCGDGKYPLIRAAKVAAMGQVVSAPTCKTITNNQCIPPTHPPTSSNTLQPVTTDGCRLNVNGPWGRTVGDRRKKHDNWCKHPDNCPGDPHCNGCKKCMCVCDGKPTQTTTTPKTTTTRKTTTKSKNTKQPSTGCQPTSVFAFIPGYHKWCANHCYLCGKGRGVESFCLCNGKTIQPKCEVKKEYKEGLQILKVLCNRYCGSCQQMKTLTLTRFCTCQA